MTKPNPTPAPTPSPTPAPSPSPAPASSKTVKAKYEVISPLDLNNERFDIGAVVTLTEKEAEPLLGHTVKVVENA